MSGGYRDPSDARRARLESIRSQVADAESKFPGRFWSSGNRAWKLEPPTEAARDDADVDLDAAIADAEARLVQLERAWLWWTDAEAAWTAPPPLAPEIPLRPPVETFDSSDLALARRWAVAAQRALNAIARGAFITARGGQAAFGGKFTADGVPFALLIEPDSIAIATSVPKSCAPLKLSPSGSGSGWRRVLRLERDIAVGDSDFDQLFVVDCDADVARVLLTAEVRRALMDIDDVPTLHIADCAATLRWTQEPTARGITAALAVLTALRNAPPTHGRPQE